MNTKKEKKTIWNVPIVTFYIFCICIFLLYIQLAYLSFSNKVYGKNMSEFAKTRNTVKSTITASRGTIYDSKGDVLAQNVSSYTIIAYLNKSRKDYVKNTEKTANGLSSVLGADVNYFKKLLDDGKSDKKYQIEFGSIGKGITELTKDSIKALNLDGIDFIENTKRYYPNGNFASYIIGYAKEKKIETFNEDTDKKEEDIELTGELGIEAYYDKILKGTDGYLEYQQDRYGYKISDTKEISIDASNGYNIYLTLDSGVQRFVESAIEKNVATYNPEWIQINVMNAKTGAILGTSSSPSFDPNLRNIKSYESPLVTYMYEPGSTMKIYTYMCAIDANKYDGNATFNSGSIQIGDYTVKDWNKYGWGTITYDKGFEYSSNVGIANLMNNYLSAAELKSCLKKYGFGEKTGIELPREQSGKIGFKYSIEVANAGFGQGITTTAVQQLQAASMIANDGKYVKPYIVDKIINPNENTTFYEASLKKSDRLVQSTTVNKMKQLMYNAIHGTDPGTAAKAYNIDGIDLIGKTGTAQIYNTSGTGYLTGYNDYIYSFIGMYPSNDPEIIIYASMNKPTSGGTSGLAEATKDVIKNVAKYYNIYTETKTSSTKSYTLKSYLNKNTEDVRKTLTDNGFKTTVIGTGSKVIAQYPAANTTVLSTENIILLTNSRDYVMPDITGWSKKEVTTLASLLSLELEASGYGYAENQSISALTSLEGQTKLIVSF